MGQRLDLELEGDASAFQGGAITVGNLDGLHLGHQELLAKLKSAGGGRPRIVITFDPHPRQVLKPEIGLKKLFPTQDLIEQLQLPRFGVDLLAIFPFDRDFARLTASEFLEKCVWKPFRPKYFVAGHDFAFGQGRQGTLDLLQDWGSLHAVQIDIVPALCVGSAVVSSRQIRDLIAEGDVAAARRLLGRPFYLRGQVIRGAGRGQGLGFPTLNLAVENETIPRSGVYVTRTLFKGQAYDSVTNIGTNPTFETGHVTKVETHVLDVAIDWNGESIDVKFLERLRGERKFSGVEELRKQIHMDINQARMVLRSDVKL